MSARWLCAMRSSRLRPCVAEDTGPLDVVEWQSTASWCGSGGCVAALCCHASACVRMQSGCCGVQLNLSLPVKVSSRQEVGRHSFQYTEVDSLPCLGYGNYKVGLQSSLSGTLHREAG